MSPEREGDSMKPQFLQTDPPAYGQPRQLSETIWQVKMPLPFRLNHVNLWFLRDDDGWTIIDTGYTTDDIRAHWDDVFADFLNDHPVHSLVVTHYHPDHAGLAKMIVERTGAQFYMPRVEWLQARSLGLDLSDEYVDVQVAHMRRCSLGEAAIERAKTLGNTYRLGSMPIPSTFRALKDGQWFHMGGRDWHVACCGGHAPEMATFFGAGEGVFISADQVLQKISPNISVWAGEPDADPLDDYLTDLKRLRRLPDDIIVLPSHGQPFAGLHHRIQELIGHHDERLSHVMDAVRTSATTADVMQHLFADKLDQQQTFFALGETLAHLNYLMHRGQLTRETGDDDVYRYVRR